MFSSKKTRAEGTYEEDTYEVCNNLKFFFTRDF